MTGLKDDRSGQALLTFGFLFAIIITIIALMLNNLIYTNNQAYIGFMGQSTYNDQSIKDATVNQVAAAYAASNGNPALFGSFMDDYVGMVNNITLKKGKYIEFTPLNVAPMPGTPGTYPATESLLTIHEQDYTKSYVIKTNYTYTSAAPTPVPVPAAAPANTIVRIGSNRTEICANGNDRALIVIEATDSKTGMPASFIRVDLHMNGGEIHDYNGGTPIYSVVTDVNGKALAEFYSLTVKSMIINASVGPVPSLASKNLSGNLYISCTNLPPAGTCSHVVNINDPTASYSSKHTGHTTFHTVTISIPVVVPGGTYNFQNFAATASIEDLTNLQLLSVGDIDDIRINNLQGTSPYTGNVKIKLNWINYPSPYSARIKVMVSALCNPENGPYANSRTITVNGPPPP